MVCWEQDCAVWISVYALALLIILPGPTPTLFRQAKKNIECCIHIFLLTVPFKRNHLCLCNFSKLSKGPRTSQAGLLTQDEPKLNIGQNCVNRLCIKRSHTKVVLVGPPNISLSAFELINALVANTKLQAAMHSRPNLRADRLPTTRNKFTFLQRVTTVVLSRATLPAKPIFTEVIPRSEVSAWLIN